MKKYLNRKTIEIFTALAFVGFSFSLSNSYAKTKIDYYKEVFAKEFGFKIYNSVNGNFNPIEDFLNSDLENKYLVILASMLDDTEFQDNLLSVELPEDTEVSNLSEDSKDYLLTDQKRVIFICDKEFSLNFPFSYTCDESSVNSKELFSVGNILKSDNSQNLDLYVIPENLILSPKGREELKEYIKAIKRSENVPLISEDASVEIDEVSLKEKIVNLSESITYEFFFIALSVTLVVVLSSGLLKFLAKENRKISFKDLREFLNINKHLSLYQKIIFYFLIWAGIIYFVLMSSLSIKDNRSLNIPYIFSYSLDSLNLEKLGEYASLGGYFRLMVFFYETVLLSLVLILIIPGFISFFKVSFLKTSGCKIKQEIGRYSIPFLIIISIASTSFLKGSSLLRFQIFLISIMVFLFFINLRDSSFRYFYSKKDKLIFLTTSFALFVVFFLTLIRRSQIGPIYTYEDLIGVKDSVVLLPYSKQLGPSKLINEYIFSGSEPVFVNHYLIYSPSNSRIENRNAVDFKNEGVFYIQNGDLEDIVSAIYKNENLSKELMTASPSNFFRIRNFQNDYDDLKPEIQITFSCERQQIDVNEIKVDFYYMDKDDEVQNENQRLLYFPGCSEIGKSEILSAELDIPDSEAEYLFIRLVDVLGSDIEDIKIINSGEIIRPVYYSKSRGYGIIDSGGLTISAKVPITNYIFGDSYDLSFDLNGVDSADGMEVTVDNQGEPHHDILLNDSADSQGFDISQPINKLIREGLLKDRFLIWSTKKYLPMRLPD